MWLLLGIAEQPCFPAVLSNLVEKVLVLCTSTDRDAQKEKERQWKVGQHPCPGSVMLVL